MNVNMKYKHEVFCEIVSSFVIGATIGTVIFVAGILLRADYEFIKRVSYVSGIISSACSFLIVFTIYTLANSRKNERTDIL